MTLVFLRCLVSIFFFFNGTLALFITVPSTVSVGQSVLVNWTRNDVDPIVFFLSLKETSGVPLTSTPVSSTGALVGCISIDIPMQLIAGTYIFLAYDIMGPLTVETPPLTGSNTFTLLSPFSATSTMPVTNYPSPPPSPSPSPSIALQFPPGATEANTALVVGSIVGGGIAATLIILLTFILMRCYRRRSNPNIFFDKEKMLRRRTPSFSTSPFPGYFNSTPEPPTPTPLTEQPKRRSRTESRLSGNGRKNSASSIIQNIVDPPASQEDSSNTTTMTTDTTNKRFSPPIIMTTPASPEQEPTRLPPNSGSESPPPSPKRFSPTPPQPPPLSARLNLPVFRRARPIPVRQYKPSSLNAEVLLINREMMQLEQEGEHGPSDLFTQRRQ